MHPKNKEKIKNRIKLLENKIEEWDELGFIPNEKITCYLKAHDSIAFELNSSIYGMSYDAAEKIILK